jgi:hypothetical protein
MVKYLGIIFVLFSHFVFSQGKTEQYFFPSTGGSTCISEVDLIAPAQYQITHCDGHFDTIFYGLDNSHLSTDGKIDMIDIRGNVINSIDICHTCPPDQVTAVDNMYTICSCDPFFGNIAANDLGCMNGPTIYSFNYNNATNVLPIVDAGGTFICQFTTCDPTANYSFVVKASCIDGTVSYQTVSLDLQNCNCGLAEANTDNYALPNPGSYSFSVGVNDITCLSGSASYTIVTPPFNSSATMNPNGTGVIIPNSGFFGRDSFLYEIKCGGIICDTAYAKYIIVQGSASDDYYIAVSGVCLGCVTPLNVSTNDGGCTFPAVTTWAWTSTLIPPSAGTITGVPTAHSFTPANNFCGVAQSKYGIYCDGILYDQAYAFYYVSCALANADIMFTDSLDKKFNGNVATNDLPCTNGAQTTFHLTQNNTAHGTGLNLKTWYCDKGNCPSYANQSPIRLIAWDTLTGKFTLDTVSPTQCRDVCFKYRIKCRDSQGNVSWSDSTCVKLTYDCYYPKVSLLITMPNESLPAFNVNVGAWCENSSGVRKPLAIGEKLKVTIPGLGVDVDWIVGQNICTAAGISNDVGNVWQNVFWNNTITNCGAATTLTPLNLANANINIVFQKDSMAKRANRWGDGTVSPLKIGQDYLWYIINSNCGSDVKALDTIYKLYGTWHAYAGRGEIGACNPRMSGGDAAGGYPYNAINVPYMWEYPLIAGKQHVFYNGASCANATANYLPIIGTYNPRVFCSNLPIGCAPLTTGHNRDSVIIQLPSYFSGNITVPNHLIGANQFTNNGVGGTSQQTHSMMAKNRNTGTQSLRTRQVEYYVNITRMVNGANVKPAGTTFANYEFWVGNNPGDLSLSGSNRTQVFTKNPPFIDQEITLGVYTLPVEGWYNYHSQLNLNTRPMYTHSRGSLNLYSY